MFLTHQSIVFWWQECATFCLFVSVGLPMQGRFNYMLTRHVSLSYNIYSLCFKTLYKYRLGQKTELESVSSVLYPCTVCPLETTLIHAHWHALQIHSHSKEGVRGGGNERKWSRSENGERGMWAYLCKELRLAVELQRMADALCVGVAGPGE